MADEPKTTEEPARESSGPPLPPQQRFILKVLERYGMPTLFALAIGAAFWHWSDRTATERKADRVALSSALADLTKSVQEQREVLGNIKLLLTIQVKQAQLDTADPHELEKKQKTAVELQHKVPAMAPPSRMLSEPRGL